VSASGNLALAETADLAVEFNGLVEKVLVEPGDMITKGQLLVQMDRYGLDVTYQPPTKTGGKSSRTLTILPWENQKQNLENAVLQARVSLNDAQIALKDAKSPGDSNQAPNPRNIESKQLQVERAKSALVDAQADLDKFLLTSPEIRAPFDGFVTAVNVEGGDVVFKGAIVVSVAANDKFETKISVSELDIRQVQVGMPTTVQVMAAGGALFPAIVTAISPTATRQGSTANYEVIVGLASTQDTAAPAQLREGFTVTVKILIQEKKDIISIPNRAIIRNNGGASVQVMVNETPQNRVVTLGFTNGLSTEVISGLKEGEQVVIQQTKTATSSATPQVSPSGNIRLR